MKYIIQKTCIIFAFVLICLQPLLAKEINILPKTLNYHLNIDVDYKQEKLFATCELTVQNSDKKPLDTIPLNLYRLLEVRSVKNSEGKDLSFSQDIVKFIDEERMQVNHIRVKPERPLQPGEKSTISIKYDGYLHGYLEVMGYVRDHIDKKYTVLRPDCLAFPKVGVPSWKINRAAGLQDFSYIASVTVPGSLVIANGGKLISKKTEEGKTTYTYRDLVPSWRIDLAISNYQILEDPKHKFKIFYFPQDKEGAKSLLQSMSKAMELYTRWFGPLKIYKGLTVIEIPDGYGSQTDITTILQVESAFKSNEKHYRFYHELSHLWNVKSRDKLPPRFESEGLAMFLQHLVQEKLEGKPQALEKAVQKIRDRFRKACENNPEWKNVPMIAYGEKGITDLSYLKGMIFFYILDKLLGEEKFLKTMGSFYQDYYNTGATAREFLDYVKKRSPINLDLFFKEWVLGAKSSELIIGQIPITEIVNRYRR